MNRFVIMTVGKTHSGKTTFAKSLEKQLSNSVVIDQDHQAQFLNTFYPALLPKQGPNKIKYALTQTIVDYAVRETNHHLIVCNSNLNRQDRIKWLEYYRCKGFTRVLVHFDLPDDVLEERVGKSKRSKNIFRVPISYQELLARQQELMSEGSANFPREDEADHLLVIQNPDEVESVIGKIIKLVKG